MTTRFGFDDAGVGFDQAAFASTYADVLLEAGATFPAFTTSATLQTRTPTRHEIQASKTFPAVTATTTIHSESPLTVDCHFPRLDHHCNAIQARAKPPIRRGYGNVRRIGKHGNASPTHPGHIARSTSNRRYGRIRRD